MANKIQTWNRYARNREISRNYFGSVTKMLPYGSTHPAPPLPRVLETAYYEDIVKPVHKPTNPRKNCTRNTNWRARVARLKLKQNDDCLSAIFSPARPKMRASGWQPTEKWTFNRYVIVGISEAFGVAIKKSRVRWHMIVLSIIARRRAQSVAVSSFEKNSRKGCDRFEKKTSGLPSPWACRPRCS